MFHCGAPDVGGKTFLQSGMEGVTIKYYVSKKETPVLKAYVRKGERGGLGGRILLEILMT